MWYRIRVLPISSTIESSNPTHLQKKSGLCARFFLIGGERGIRTLDGLLAHTPLAGERLRPLGHLSRINWYKYFMFLLLYLYYFSQLAGVAAPRALHQCTQNLQGEHHSGVAAENERFNDRPETTDQPCSPPLSGVPAPPFSIWIFS